MVTLASTCRKDPRTAETMRKGCWNGAERLRNDSGKSAGTKLQGGNTGDVAEIIRKYCGNILDTMRNMGSPAADTTSECTPRPTEGSALARLGVRDFESTGFYVDFGFQN